MKFQETANFPATTDVNERWGNRIHQNGAPNLPKETVDRHEHKFQAFHKMIEWIQK